MNVDSNFMSDVVACCCAFDIDERGLVKRGNSDDFRNFDPYVAHLVGRFLSFWSR